MNKRTKRYTNVLNEVNEMLNHVKTLNEAISFDEDYDIEKEFNNDEYDTNYDSEPMDEPVEKPTNDSTMDEMNDIDRIREIALKGMLKYVKQSNSSEYETLKKIFQFCDKVNNDKSNDNMEDR